jgi:RHS repeat-associated protein
VVAVSNASGNLIGINTYDEYGKPGAANIGRFQYTGQKWLPEIGSYDYKNRLYDPTDGRFMQTDPIGYGSGPNIYAYVRSDPVNLSDPLGLRGSAEDYAFTRPNYDIIVTGNRANCGEYCLAVAPQNVSYGPSYPTDPSVEGNESSGGNDRMICPTVTAKITGVGPNQAAGPGKSSISQVPGSDLPNGAVAIDPQDFGVSGVTVANREVFRRIVMLPNWQLAQTPSNGAPQEPTGLPSEGPYFVHDVIGPKSARGQPGLQLDLYRYGKQSDALRSTRNVPVTPLIPVNKQGVSCPTGK